MNVIVSQGTLLQIGSSNVYYAILNYCLEDIRRRQQTGIAPAPATHMHSSNMKRN